MKDGIELTDLVLKFRTVIDKDEVTWAIAYATKDNIEVARIRTSFFKSPGDPEFHKWIDLVSELHRRIIEHVTGEEGITMRRRKADYKSD